MSAVSSAHIVEGGSKPPGPNHKHHRKCESCMCVPFSLTTVFVCSSVDLWIAVACLFAHSSNCCLCRRSCSCSRSKISVLMVVSAMSPVCRIESV